jgi:hypothetical protein
MNTWNRIRALAAALALGWGLAGCGGGEGVGSGGTGISLLSVAVGSVTRMDGADHAGRVVVNGVRFDVSAARIETTDAQGLQLGMTVQVSGTVDAALSTGTASYVLSTPELRGRLDAVDAAQGRFSVMGVPVSVDAAAVFAGVADMAALQPGQNVQVYALPAASGAMRATRVETLSPQPASPVLWGEVQALDTAARQFRLGDLQVNYAQAVFGHGLDAASLANGVALYVSATDAPAGNVLAAVQLRPAHALSPQPASPVALTGLVTGFASLQSFTLQGARVDVTQAQISGGTAGQIANGVKLEVAGRMVGDVLVAERVRMGQVLDAGGAAAPLADALPAMPVGGPAEPVPGEPSLPGNGSDGGNGDAHGNGQGNANGNGDGSGNANGQGSGSSSGNGNGNASGNGNGNGNGSGNGNGNGSGSGNGNGNGSGNANGQGSGNSNSSGNSNGNGRKQQQQREQQRERERERKRKRKRKCQRPGQRKQQQQREQQRKRERKCQRPGQRQRQRQRQKELKHKR